jgi:hypothetical protein
MEDDMDPQTTIELASSEHRDRQRAGSTAIHAGTRRQGQLRALVGAALVHWGNRLGGTNPRHSARRLTVTAAR